MDEAMSFLCYWNQIDREMLRVYGIDTMDAGTEPEMIAAAQEDGWSPREYVLWFGEKYGLTRLPGAA
jgi:hypothetical protein